MSNTNKIVPIEKNLPHEVSEVICLKCYYRFMSVIPSGTLLKNIECGRCNQKGYVIKTGQDLDGI